MKKTIQNELELDFHRLSLTEGVDLDLELTALEALATSGAR